MKRVVLSTLAMLLLVLTLAIETRAQGNKNSAAPPTQKRVIPKGMVMKSNRATAKAGYKFEKTSGNTVVARRARGTGGGGLGYALTCTCKAGSSGICTAEVSPTTATCSGNCGCSFQVATEGFNAPAVKSQ
jgi:hypothetical protein